MNKFSRDDLMNAISNYANASNSDSDIDEFQYQIECMIDHDLIDDKSDLIYPIDDESLNDYQYPIDDEFIANARIAFLAISRMHL